MHHHLPDPRADRLVRRLDADDLDRAERADGAHRQHAMEQLDPEVGRHQRHVCGERGSGPGDLDVPACLVVRVPDARAERVDEALRRCSSFLIR